MMHIENNVLLGYADEPDEQHIIVPDGIVKIGDNAFQGCQNIVTVTLPASVKEITAYAFADCPMLEAVIIPQPIEISSTALGEGFFFEHPRIVSTNAALLDWCSIDFGDELAAGYAYALYNGIQLDDSVIEENDEYFSDCWLGYFHYQFTDDYLIKYFLDKRFVDVSFAEQFMENRNCGEKLRAMLLEYRNTFPFKEKNYELD